MNRKPRTPHPVDIAVGANIRRLRRALRLSQEGLAAAVNVTFQQVQKYEHGTNRVSASMLYEISRVLSCDAADLLPRGDWQAAAPDESWREIARRLHVRHPRLLEALSQWPEAHLKILLASTQALRA